MTLTPDYDAATHTYSYQGVGLPGVTEILRSAGVVNSQWYTEESRERGSMVASATEHFDRGMDLAKVQESIDRVCGDLADYVKGCLTGWTEFLVNTECEIQWVERRVMNFDWMYAGTLDRRLWLNGDDVVIDIKTGSIAAWHQIQTAAYAECIGPNLRRGCVYLKPEGTYTYRPHGATEGRDAWYAAVTLHHWKRNNGVSNA